VSGTETWNAEMTKQTAQQQVSKEGNRFVAYLKESAGKKIQRSEIHREDAHR